ncbi:MAG: hypothetical protein HYW48_10330 [Deltaproteobacteria bacterium]|nr:hypothetical protein [Deltaproteobacteria bacterium]
MEEPAAQFPPNHLLAPVGLRFTPADVMIKNNNKKGETLRSTIFKLLLLSEALIFAGLLRGQNEAVPPLQKEDMDAEETQAPPEKGTMEKGERELAYTRPRVTLGLLPSYIVLSGDLENYGGSVPAFSLAFKKTGFGGWGETFPVYMGVFESVSFFSASNETSTSKKQLESGHFLLGLEFMGTKPQVGFEVVFNFGLGLYIVNTKDTPTGSTETTKENKTKAAPFFGLGAGYRVMERLSLNFATSMHAPSAGMTYTQWQLGAWIIL